MNVFRAAGGDDDDGAAVEKHKVIVLGDSNCGKTSIIQRAAYGAFDQNQPLSVGVSFVAKLHTLKSGRKIKFQIWDTAGQERFKSVTQSYFRGTHAAIIVFDMTHEASLNNCANWLDELRRECGGDVDRVPVFLVGNKSDLPVDLRIPGLKVKIEALCKGGRYTRYMEASAKEGHNIAPLFEAMARAAHRNWLRPRGSAATGGGGGGGGGKYNSDYDSDNSDGDGDGDGDEDDGSMDYQAYITSKLVVDKRKKAGGCAC